jgi:hypothetical protein
MLDNLTVWIEGHGYTKVSRLQFNMLTTKRMAVRENGVWHFYKQKPGEGASSSGYVWF